MTDTSQLRPPALRDGAASFQPGRDNVVQGAFVALQTLLVRLRPLLLMMFVMAILGMAGAAMIWGHVLAPIVLTAATTLALIALAGGWALAVGRRRRRATAETLIAASAHDPDAVLLTDREGRGLAANPAALAARHGSAAGDFEPAELLTRWCAEPERVSAALMADALVRGQGRREFTRPQEVLRALVYRADTAQADAIGPGILVWRFSVSVMVPTRGIDALGLPMLTLGPGDTLVTVNDAFRALFGEPGMSLSAPEGGETILPLAPEIETALEPLLRGANPATVTLSGAGGAQTRLAYASPACDGQRDILFLPAWLASAGQPPIPTSRHDFEDIPVALMLIDAEGRIVDSNRPARGLLGLAPGEPRHFWEVVEGLGRPVADWLDDAREGRALNRPEVLRATLPPQETFVQIILRRASGPDRANALVAVISDATELKSLEARFVQSQKMQAIGQLAGGVAHDFNNLLTAISGHCDLLLINRDHYDPDYNDLVQIHQNTNRAAALVRQLLAFSRKQTLRPETLSLESLLEELAHLLTRLVGERITLTLSHDPRICTIRADRRQLEQVIMNLVVNARDAMPMGGEILIETEALRLDRECERGRVRLPAGDYAVIRVIDEGVGIPADIIDKIFEPFFTTKRTGEGTGLGLSTAYGIVKQMGGWIFASSTEGTGTEFTLFFAAHHDSTGDPAELDQLQQRRIRGGAEKPVSGVSAPSVAEIAQPVSVSAPVSDFVSARGESGNGAGVASLGGKTQVMTGKPIRGAKATMSDETDHGPMGFASGAPTAIEDTGPGFVNSAPVAHTQAPTLRTGPMGATVQQVTERDGSVVLLVEDEGPVRAFAARALRLQGYHVIEAENGEQALEFLEDRELKVDIFVTDVVMPGIDGPGWVSRALVQRPGTPVVFVSGYTEDGLRTALSRIPRSVFMGKPFALHDLTATIASQLARQD